MAPTLYMIPYSQPVRATLMTLKALNIEADLKEVILKNNEQLTSEFTKINPQHTVPTLVDEDGFVLWESHAIMPYLVEKYGKDDALYPNDLQKRAIVDQRLHFNNGVVFPLNVLRPIIYGRESFVTQEKIDKTNETYEFLEQFINGNDWVAGDFLSIADFALIATITSLDVVIPIDSKRFPNICKWIKNCEQLPYYDSNKRGLLQIKEMVENNLKKSK